MTSRTPFPDRRVGPRSPYAVLLAKLEVGDTFEAPARHRARISVLASTWGRRLGRKFSTSRNGSRCLVGRTA